MSVLELVRLCEYTAARCQLLTSAVKTWDYAPRLLKSHRNTEISSLLATDGSLRIMVSVADCLMLPTTRAWP